MRCPGGAASPTNRIPWVIVADDPQPPEWWSLKLTGAVAESAARWCSTASHRPMPLQIDWTASAPSSPGEAPTLSGVPFRSGPCPTRNAPSTGTSATRRSLISGAPGGTGGAEFGLGHALVG